MKILNRKLSLGVPGAAVFTALLVVNSHAQVGKSLGVVDANLAPEADLLKMPHMTPAIVKGLTAKRHFVSIVDLNAYLTGAGLTAAQAMEFHTKAFVFVNLSTATKEIGKYVGQKETDRLWRFVAIK